MKGPKVVILFWLQKYIAGSIRVIQQGGPDPWENWVGPPNVGAYKSFLFTESSLVV